MSRFEFDLPDVGEGLVNAEIVTWHVTPGDRVVEGQPLVSVETDIAVVEIPAPRSGQVVRCVGKSGDQVNVGDLLAEFESEIEDPGAVVGELVRTQSPPAPSRLHSRSRAENQFSAKNSSRRARPVGDPLGAMVRASPAARRRARELGVDLAQAKATGPGGVVQVGDVEALLSVSDDSSEPLSGVRRAMARRMADAGARVVPATVTGEAEITAWLADARPLIRLIQAVVKACGAVPELNAAFDDRRFTLSRPPVVNLGLAMETEQGLFVPVISAAESLGPEELASEVDRLRAAVRSREVSQNELRGQTITVSNFGAVAGRHATMVVVPPQVAIVGAGRAFPQPMLDGETVRAGRVLPLTVTFDHRAVTGNEACRFLEAMINQLEQETAS